MVWHYSRNSFHFYLFYFKIFVYFYLCICWLGWVLSSFGAQASPFGGFSLWGAQTQSLGSVAVVHRFSCPAARGTFPDWVTCTGWRILNHWSTRDIPGMVFIQWAWFVFLWWVMMLCTLLYAYWQLVFLLLLSMCSTCLPIVEFFCLFTVELYKSFIF